MKKHLTSVVLFAVAAAAARPARAEDAKQACIAASTEGQTLRKDQKLFEARDRLAVCARDVCPDVVKSFCVRWLAQLEEQIPSVVVRAQDDSGADVLDAHVSIDGTEGHLDGRPVPLDPGPHTVVVENKGTRKEVKLLLAAGEKSRAVVVHLPTPAAAPEAPVAAPPPPPGGAAPAKHEAPGTPAGAWILGGLGVASLVASGIFGYEAWNEVQRLSQPIPAGCAPGCSPAQTAPGRADAALFDVFLGVGVGGVGIGVIWALVAHNSGSDGGLARTFDFRPVPGGATVGLAGPFEIGPLTLHTTR